MTVLRVELPRLTTAAQAASAFRRLRARLVRNELQSLLASSLLRVGLILVCSTIFWSGLFILFFEGFQFLASFVKLTNEIIEHVFGLFFLSLLIMLVFSTGIIMYTGLFNSRESAFLLTSPASTDRIFAYKFLEAMAFSSWGFMLLGSPMMVAYGITVGAPWPFYLVFLVYLIAFVLIPGSLGGIGAIIVANYLPRRRKTVLAVCAAGLIVFFVLLVMRVFQTPGDALTRDWMDALLGRLRFSQNELLPSRWISKGLIGAARSEWDDGLFYLMVTSAHAALAYLIAALFARDLYRRGYSKVQGDRSSRRRFGLYGLDNAFHRILFFIPRTVRLLILKDLRTFRRDPAQWSQFLIFFGLLAFYFINIRRLGYNVQNAYWRNLLSLLNMAVTALILSTFTSRFIFPMLSLEGRNFWVLGLLPLRREAILWGKFAFASGISLVATEGLVVLSDSMLQIGPTMLILHIALVAILCLGLSGISVGLGARLPNLKEDDPSKIAAGFGGTLNLLVSLIFITIVIAAMAIPCHLLMVNREVNEMAFHVVNQERFNFWLAVAATASVIAGAIATIVPLRIGIKAFQRMEF
jgi:ABC-2 type transport system permease protein